jgi:hypothetical protein
MDYVGYPHQKATRLPARSAAGRPVFSRAYRMKPDDQEIACETHPFDGRHLEVESLLIRVRLFFNDPEPPGLPVLFAALQPSCHLLK